MYTAAYMDINHLKEGKTEITGAKRNNPCNVLNLKISTYEDGFKIWLPEIIAGALTLDCTVLECVFKGLTLYQCVYASY